MSIIMDTAAALDMLQKAVSGTLPMKQLRQQAKAVGGLSADELEEASNQDDQRAFLVSTILAKVGAVGIGAAGTSDSQQDHASPPAGVDAGDEASQLTTAEIDQALEQREVNAGARFDLWNGGNTQNQFSPGWDTAADTKYVEALLEWGRVDENDDNQFASTSSVCIDEGQDMLFQAITLHCSLDDDTEPGHDLAQIKDFGDPPPACDDGGRRCPALLVAQGGEEFTINDSSETGAN